MNIQQDCCVLTSLTHYLASIVTSSTLCYARGNDRNMEGKTALIFMFSCYPVESQ